MACAHFTKKKGGLFLELQGENTPLQETLDVLGRGFTSALHGVEFPCDYAGEPDTVWFCFAFRSCEESVKIQSLGEFEEPLLHVYTRTVSIL